jgi:hypothetical protein
MKYSIIGLIYQSGQCSLRFIPRRFADVSLFFLSGSQMRRKRLLLLVSARIRDIFYRGLKYGQ